MNKTVEHPGKIKPEKGSRICDADAAPFTAFPRLTTLSWPSSSSSNRDETHRHDPLSELEITGSTTGCVAGPLKLVCHSYRI